MYTQSNFADPRVIPGAPRSISAHSRIIPGARPNNYLSQRSKLILEHCLCNLLIFVNISGLNFIKNILAPHTSPTINWVSVAPDNRNTPELKSHVPPDNRNTPQLMPHELWGVVGVWDLGGGLGSGLGSGTSGLWVCTWGLWLWVWDLGALGLGPGAWGLGLGALGAWLGTWGPGTWGLKPGVPDPRFQEQGGLTSGAWGFGPVAQDLGHGA